jgi:hypothetical protein
MSILALMYAAVPNVAAQSADSTLVLHYTFDAADGNTVADVSDNGHNGTFVNAEWLDEVNGRAGVLRFSGKDSILDVADPKGANPEGDMTFEMWVRRNGEVSNTWATLFGDVHDFCFYYAGYHSLLLWYTTVDPVQGGQSMLVPVRRDIFSDNWSHIAVVVEYPRCRFYHNGALVRDAYLPVRAIANRVTKELVLGKNVPMDIDEFRLYHRALSADEIAAHAAGREVEPAPAHELAIEPNWYAQTLTLRFVGKNEDDAGRTVTFTVDDASQTVPIERQWSRFVASAEFPLQSGARAITATLLAGETVVDTLTRDETLTKPDWIHSREGYTDAVPIPWTPVEVGRDGQATTLDIWARQYTYADAAWPSAIQADGESLLTGPITLVGRADGKPIAWADQPVELVRHDDRGATLRQQRDALMWLLTRDRQYIDDAMRQIEALFDVSMWPQWSDQRHLDLGLVADLRTGQLLRAFGYMYDWLYDALSDADRQWIVEGFDRRAIQPYLEEVDRNAWFIGTGRMNNWNTVVVGGAGTAAMALGDDHPDSQRIYEHAVHVMDVYCGEIGQDGEFNESVGYAGSMQCPIEFHATHRYHVRGEQNRLAQSPFPEFCRWYMHML